MFTATYLPNGFVITATVKILYKRGTFHLTQSSSNRGKLLLSEFHIRSLAKKTGLGAPQLHRILGSVRVPVEKGEASTYELGFAFIQLEPRALTGAALVEPLSKLIESYRLACPAVVQWIMSGGFKASDPPKDVRKSNLQHACRTVGRLRAGFLRQTGLTSNIH